MALGVQSRTAPPLGLVFSAWAFLLPDGAVPGATLSGGRVSSWKTVSP